MSNPRSWSVVVSQYQGWFNQKWVRRTGLILCWAFLVMWGISPWYQISLRVDESFPSHYLFFIDHQRAPHRGDLASFVMPSFAKDRVKPEGIDRPYLRIGDLWMKRVVGVPGDRVEIQGLQVLINGTVVGESVVLDRAQQPISLADFPQVIPPGFVYLSLETHPRSFDSRYLGLLPSSILEGVVTPLI